MKYLIPLFAISLLLSACGGGGANGEAIPEDLQAKKALLKEKKAELQKLTALVANLEAQIDSLDPNGSLQRKQLVTTAPVTRKNFKHFVEIQGSVQADDLLGVTSEVAGRIIRLTVKEGDPVRSGQLIAKLDMEQLQKQMAEVETSLDLANTVYERQKRLWDQNIGSELQFLEAKNTKERLEKSLETLKFQLTKSEVYSPVSGVVERVAVQSGEFASPGMPIVQILNTDKLKVVANVPENYLRAVNRGESVVVRFPAVNVEQQARISLVGRTIDPGNRTFSVEADIQSAGERFKPNLLAVMLINDFTAENVVTIPLNMVQQEVSGKDFVFVKEDSPQGPVARKKYVETGRSYNGEIVITSGLQGGEELILQGARGLADNALIEVQNLKTEANNG
jgi:membrane fusion protein, multidrug efflux system